MCAAEGSDQPSLPNASRGTDGEVAPIERSVGADLTVEPATGDDKSDHESAPHERAPSDEVAVSSRNEGALATSQGVPEEHLLTHMPKRDDCETCQIAKAQHRQCRRVRDHHRVRDYPEPMKFGDLITMDHIVTLSPGAASNEGHADALTVKDLATGWTDC